MLRDALANGLGLTGSYVSRLAKTASHRYRVYDIDKRTGGKRTISHPAKQLKAVQRWLQTHIVSRFPVHPAAAAYRPERNIADHARLHLKSRFLLRVDLVQFFESIKAQDIAVFLKSQAQHLPAEWTLEDSEMFAQLVCRGGALTIGAVTSPGLSNAICFELDSDLAAHCAKKKVIYSRYADDLFFSTSTPNVLSAFPGIVAAVLAELKCPGALQVNPSKTRHSSLKRRRRVTGLILSTQGQVSIGRELKRAIRSRIHRFEGLAPKERTALAGTLAFCRDVEPEFFNRLVLKYGSKALAATKF